MMEKEITSIRAQQRNPQRVNIYLDGEFAFGLSRITAAWLKPGRKLSEAEIDKLVNEDDREVAFQQALHYLSFRARSENEVRQNLHKKGFSDPIIDETIEKCKASAYVNDLDFAHQWIENRSTFRPRSIKLLSMELRQKGLPDDTINMALEDLSTPEEELAYQAALKKVDRYRSLDWQTFRNKLGSFLARRGFSYSITAPVVKRCWDELAQDPKNQNNTLDME
jgi:regulatory protein